MVDRKYLDMDQERLQKLKDTLSEGINQVEYGDYPEYSFEDLINDLACTKITNIGIK